MFRTFTATLAVLAALSLTDGRATARAVSLTDARTAPSYLRYVMPGRAVTITRQCVHAGGIGYWQDVSAYRWHGRALAAQRWTPGRSLTYWRDSRGGRVTFDGLTFHNATRYPVIVAGWCH